jgi:hypothetical protein
MINYPNSATKTIPLLTEYHNVIRQLALGNPKSIVSAFMHVSTLKDQVIEATTRSITCELQQLCAKTTPSLLRQTTKDDLKHFTWKNVHDELKERTPVFLRFIEAAVQNPSQKRNVQKKNEALIPPMCDAACKLISIFNEGMCAIRVIKSIILKKGGLTKVGFKRLSSTYVCMGYNCTNNIFERFGKDFDCDLLKWKKQVEEDVKKEKELLSVVSTLGGIVSNEELECANEKLQQHRQSMHPGYSLTGDNVDMIVKPRQMTKQHQNKDHHMFQYVAYENRVSPNHMPGDITVADINKVPFTSFLPSGDEQLSLIDQFTVLVCQKWAKYIPNMGWFKDCMPSYIPHKHMDDMKKKTSKV